MYGSEKVKKELKDDLIWFSSVLVSPNVTGTGFETEGFQPHIAPTQMVGL